MIPETSTTLLSRRCRRRGAGDVDRAFECDIKLPLRARRNGRFRNYLTGILRRKALKQCEKADKERTAKAELRELEDAGAAFGSLDDSDSWKDAVLEIAMRPPFLQIQHLLLKLHG